MNENLVSVIMPIYNASRFLREAIDSVLNQTYKDLELLLVDDCSTDDSFLIVKEYEIKDTRVRVFQNEKNKGVAETRNLGISHAIGKYIALLDSDDVWLENKIERQVCLLEEKKAHIAYCSYDFIDENSRRILSPFIVPEKTNYNMMCINCVISSSTILTRSEVLEGHYFDASHYLEDYVLWMELLAAGAIAVGDKRVLAHYRQVAGQRSGNKLNAAKQRWIVFRDVLHLGFWKRLSAFVRYAVNAVMKYYG